MIIHSNIINNLNKMQVNVLNLIHRGIIIALMYEY